MFLKLQPQTLIRAVRAVGPLAATAFGIPMGPSCIYYVGYLQASPEFLLVLAPNVYTDVPYLRAAAGKSPNAETPLN